LSLESILKGGSTLPAALWRRGDPFRRVPAQGRTVAITSSGGTIDRQLFSEIICEGQETALSRQ
jgi:hypothetical protein